MSLTKTQLEDQVADLHKQVESLQTELTDRSFQLDSMEALATSYEAELGDLVSEIIEDASDHAQLLDMTDLAAGLASQLGWTISMVQSIGLSAGGSDPTLVQKLTEVLLKASEPFWEGYTQGLYEPAQLLPEEAPEEVAGEEVTAVSEGLSDIDWQAIAEFIRVEPIEQEIPDEEPDGSHTHGSWATRRSYDENSEAFFVEPLAGE